MAADRAALPNAPAATGRADLRTLDDARLVQATIAHDQSAWRELMRRHARALGEAARDADEQMSEADADDLVSDLWLSLIEDDLRVLRSFEPARGAALLSWLTIRLSQLICRREAKRADEPDTVPLVEARKLPAPPAEPAPSVIDRTLLRVEEVARRWGLDRKTIYGMIERGEITARRCGRLVRIPRNAVESFESQASVAPERHMKCR